MKKAFKVYKKYREEGKGYWCNEVYESEGSAFLLKYLIEEEKRFWEEVLAVGEKMPEPAFYKVKEIFL